MPVTGKSANRSLPSGPVSHSRQTRTDSLSSDIASPVTRSSAAWSTWLPVVAADSSANGSPASARS